MDPLLECCPDVFKYFSRAWGHFFESRSNGHIFDMGEAGMYGDIGVDGKPVAVNFDTQAWELCDGKCHGVQCFWTFWCVGDPVCLLNLSLFEDVLSFVEVFLHSI